MVWYGTSDPVVKIGGTPPTAALIRGIPFFGFDPGGENWGILPYRSLDQRYTLFWL